MNLLKFSLSALLALLTFSSPVWAAESTSYSGDGLFMPQEASVDQFAFAQGEHSKAASGTAVDTIIYWTNFFLQFAATLALIMLVYAGFIYLTAYGEEDRAKEAGKLIWKVILGLMIIFAAYAIVNTATKYLSKGRITPTPGASYEVIEFQR